MDEEVRDKPLDQQLEEAREVLQLYRSLTKSQGWVLLAEVLNDQIEGMKGEVFQRSDSMDKVLNGEFTKGVLAGMDTAVQMPDMIIEGLEEEVKMLLEETEMNRGEDDV